MSENKNNTLKIILSVILVAVVIVGGYWAYLHFWSGKSETTKKDVYTCTMHRQIISDRPGQCPICGMDLVLKSSIEETKNNGNENPNADINTVMLSPSQQVLANGLIDWVIARAK